MVKSGVTQELRARVNAHIAAESRQRLLMTVGITIAVLAVCAYLILRWLA